MDHTTCITKCTLAMGIAELDRKLEKIAPDDIIAITESSNGSYTIIYKRPKWCWDEQG